LYIYSLPCFVIIVGLCKVEPWVLVYFMSSLVPGSTQVHRFDEEDDEYEYEYETSYATLDLRNVDQNILLGSSSMKLIGLDTATPYLQFPGLTMQGAHDTLIGSELLFSDGRDPNDRSRRFVVPLGTTSARITFKPVELHPIVAPATSAQGTAESSEPPPVLFQGRRQPLKSLPKEKFLDGPAKVKTPKPRGPGKGKKKAEEGGPTAATKKGGRKVKPKGKGKKSSDEDDHEDYEGMDPSGSEDVGYEQGPSTSRATRRTRRGARAEEKNEAMDVDTGILGGLETMEDDDQETVADEP